jgi:hypothetical protein
MNTPTLAWRSNAAPRRPAADGSLRPHGPAPAGDPADAALWRVRLLGGFEIDNGRHRLTRLRSRASMALLARLAMESGRDHARDELAALLWPDGCPTRIRSRLRQTLSLLRAVLEPPGSPPVLHADHWVLRLQPGTVWCDVPAFEAALAHGDLDTARHLYRGDLLPGLDAEWLDDERRRLTARADGLGLRPVARPAVPRLTVWAGAAVPARSQPVAGVPATARLPRPSDAAYGLDEAAAALRQLLADHRRVGVVGPGGLGKTRLAVQACAGWPAAGLVYFVSVAGLRTPLQLLRRLRSVLRVASPTQPALGPQGLERLADQLGATSATLVLDGCEALDAAAHAGLSAALHRLPDLRVLTTSRGPLGLPGERLHRMAPLPPVEVDADLAALSAQPAVALFIDRARAVRPEFHLHRGNAVALVALLQRLDGWPLAIELAAAQMHHTNPAGLLAAFAPGSLASGHGHALDLLARRGPRRGDHRQHSLSAVLDDNLQLLDNTSLALLRTLADHACEWPAAAVRRLSPSGVGWDDLAPLVDLGLLRAGEDLKGRPVFRLASLLRSHLMRSD